MANVGAMKWGFVMLAVLAVLAPAAVRAESTNTPAAAPANPLADAP